MSFRRSDDYEYLSPSASSPRGTYGTSGVRSNAESTPLNRYGPPPPPAASSSQSTLGLFNVSSYTLRRMLIAIGLFWIASVAYLSSLGGRVLREMEEQRKMNLAAMGGGRMLASERHHPAMGSSYAGADATSFQQQQQQQGHLDDSLGQISSDARGTFSSGVRVTTNDGSSSTSTGTSSNVAGSIKHHSSSTAPRSAEDVTILVVYGPEYHSYIWTLAWQVALGVNSAFKKHARAVTGSVKFGTTANITFSDVLKADAVLIGSPVYNGNTHPDVQTWINYWRIESDLSRKIGGSFVTAGGIHSGAEGTLMSLMRSMMAFRMMVVGGDSWDSPYGVAATVYEDPFGDTRRSHDFSSKCYQTNSLVHPHFLRKAWDLGERVANTTFALKNSTLWNRWG
eukprot:CAMPEP_0197462562 /NCGR_PEP_ID=MMETSP1175-20131217/59395_1 /TAXON_ID=1003142 /ORGANISM="Triceratium dubium, Strain CCMP147" /LENGTH=395 /DNA_ID=CAMNT_0042998091 /DNA_START=64 /DNA_END=1251 /DNA_ORIENTATION=-